MLKIMLSVLILGACANKVQNSPMDPRQEEYWYSGEAEITSFKLNQARYGEMREGTSVMVFVTEPFSKKSMTKADRPQDDDPSVLKLNHTKNFNTGIYPYSMMTSSFLPFEGGKHSLKVTSSSQEWCGHTFMEMENRGKFKIDIRSYFEGESETINLNSEYLEDDIWSLIRINPDNLPEGTLAMIPSFFYLRLAHKETKAYECTVSKKQIDETTSSYQIDYPTLSRSLTINYETAFPYQILGWEESHFSGFGNKRQKMTTTGERIKTIKSAYWGKNSNKDNELREALFQQ